MYEGLLMGCGYEYGLFSHLGKSLYSEVVEIGHEDENVVLILVFTDIVYSRRRIRSLLLEPLFLCLGIVVGNARIEVPAVEFVEILCAELLNRKT